MFLLPPSHVGANIASVGVYSIGAVSTGPEPPATGASKWHDADQEELGRLKECGTYVLVD